MVALSMADAARMRPDAALPVMSVTTRNGAPASGSVSSRPAARPFASRKRPRAPAPCDTRSG